MKSKKIIALIEIILIVIICMVQVFPNWNNKYTTPGDLFCLEIVGLLSWNIYENLKKKVS